MNYSVRAAKGDSVSGRAHRDELLRERVHDAAIGDADEGGDG
jgi:hypothetical protein